MGCTVSKSAVEPRTVTIKLTGCSNLPRSHSSPLQVAEGEHRARDSRTESDHVVSLTSSTYGSLRLDSLPGESEARARATMGNVTAGPSGNTEDHKQVEAVNMWELMDGIEGEKAAFQALRGLMGKQNASRNGSGKRSPRVYHTLEDVDTILDVRKCLTTKYRFDRSSSVDSIPDKKTGVHSPVMQKRRARALQISQEVIEELDDLRRRNLSRSHEFGSRNPSRSQEFNTIGRGNVPRNQEVYSRARRNPSQSQDFNSVKRISLTRNQESVSRRIRNLSQSHEFLRPEPKDGFATRHSLETLRTVQTNNERRVALSEPDIVLRSPMLRVLSGKERFVSSNVERRNKPLVQGQVQPAAEWKTTIPRAAGSAKVSLNLSSPERRSGKVLEPRVASAVAAFSRLGEQRAMARSVPEREAEIFQEQSPNLAKANYYSVSKMPANTLVVTVAENTQVIVPQDGRNPSIVKEQAEHRSFSATTSGPKKQRAGTTSSPSEASLQRKACEITFTPHAVEPETLLDDPISLDYELVTKAEVAEAVLRSGSSSRRSNTTFHSTRDTNNNKTPSWSERRDCPLLDPELLASFEEALEMFTADDWCTVRIGESDDAGVTSGSTSDSGSASWLRESAGDAKFNKFEILENHVENPQEAQPNEFASSKLAPLLQVEAHKTNPLEKFEKKCPPGGDTRCVLYTTSLRGIRKTFEDCSRTRRILQCANVQIDERDIAMHGQFRQEVNDLVGRAAPVPRLFIRGRYIGGGEEVAQLFEVGTLSALLEGLPRQVSHAVCDGCGGVRFVPCPTCCGSCKVVSEEGVVACCEDCNENGLCRCPLCL